MDAPAARKQIEMALFETAVNLPDPEVRAAFLARACGADAALRARLDGLLSAHTVADGFFDLPPPPIDELVAAAAPASRSLEESRVRIGRYQLIERIGEGGCGVVYLAEQQEPVKRRVALKIIRLGMDTERVIARFEIERQALAVMNHPHIAQVLDAGATETGRPFFVMELVEGARITDYCDRRRLGTRARLELFIQVCHAIQHAHQKGILHRDIKPSNVLIAVQPGAGPAPKVIDFGVAKAVTMRSPRDTTFHDSEQFIGTPAYMSPEQAEPGRPDVDTRADIYSLGALLYELLTGRPPFDSQSLLSSGLDALRRTLQETEPVRPSRLLRSLPPVELERIAALHRSEPRALVNTLRRDLDWIVMHALEKDRSRRYATVNGLAFDLTRYLRDEPVEARPPSRSYRLRKLVRRNRVAFAATFAVTLALLAGLGASTWLFFREREALRQQTLLRRQAETAGQLTRAAFLTREGAFEAAAQVLDAVPRPLARPSFDGVVAFRSVGDWLASQRRWAEASERFKVALDIGRLDTWAPVTLDHQSYGVALILAGEEDTYRRFRADSANRFGPASDTDAVARVLKTCLLRPLDEPLRQRLLPLGARSEFWLSSLNPRLATGWAVIPVSLWRYRLGDYDEARKLARKGIDPADRTSARAATLRLIVALSDSRTGHPDDASLQLADARPVIEANFSGDLTRGNYNIGHWYDWAFAHILLAEAEAEAQPSVK
jgi:eukaryotic-like serine/threonine-protein kinase